MGRRVSFRPRRRARVLRVPGWYYGLLFGIALVGIVLILRGTRPGDFREVRSLDGVKGSPDAPVTMIEWGSFT
ncbi:MAG: hypothetical protein ACP5SI_07045 [Chloroflexia bacterium]